MENKRRTRHVLDEAGRMVAFVHPDDVTDLERRLAESEANAAQLLLIVKDVRTLVASGRLCSIGSEDNTYEVQVRSNVIQEWNNVINSSDAGAKLLEKVEKMQRVAQAARELDAFTESILINMDRDGHQRNPFFYESIMQLRNALKALDGEGK